MPRMCKNNHLQWGCKYLQKQRNWVEEEDVNFVFMNEWKKRKIGKRKYRNIYFDAYAFRRHCRNISFILWLFIDAHTLQSSKSTFFSSLLFAFASFNIYKYAFRWSRADFFTFLFAIINDQQVYDLLSEAQSILYGRLRVIFKRQLLMGWGKMQMM